MKSDMTCDLNHLEYANYLAEKELLNKSSVRNITSLTESADGEQIALQEMADIRVYLQKIVANIQNVWNKFKNSVAKLEANSVLKDYKTILGGNPVGEDIEIDEGVEIPNLAELNKLVNLQPVAFYASNEYGDINDFFKKNYNDFFNNLGDTVTPMDAANEKCFTVAKGGETIGFNKSSDSKFPTIAACYGYLNNYQNNVANVIQKDINNINNATKMISGAMDVAKKQSETRKKIYKAGKDAAEKTVSNPNNYQPSQPNAAAQTGAPTGGNNGTNNGGNNGAKNESSDVSFGYNSSYGVLMELFGRGKKSKPTSAPKKSAVKNNTTTNNATNNSNNNQQNTNNTQNGTQKKSLEQQKQEYEDDQKSTDPTTFVRNNSINFMKGLTKVLSVKFAESNKARATCLKFCVQYAKQVAEENKDNDNSNNNNNNNGNNNETNGNNNQQQQNQQDNNANVEVPQIK